MLPVLRLNIEETDVAFVNPGITPTVLPEAVGCNQLAIPESKLSMIVCER